MSHRNYFERLETDVLGAMGRPGMAWWIAIGIASVCFAMGLGLWGYQIFTGMGVAGISHPVGWGVYITNFVFWVGIAHSGTLISAVLFLFRARFRSSFNRSAEAMTVFAVMTAGLFPLIHLGRVWNFFWLLPYPNQRLLWVNIRSPLIWDVFAVTTYLTVSAIFFNIGGYFFIEALYGGLGLLAVIAWVRVRQGHTQREKLFKDAGTFIFAFALLWAGQFFAQYLVIWYGNIPEEQIFLVKRILDQPGRAMGYGVLAALFFIPFIALLSPRAKRWCCRSRGWSWPAFCWSGSSSCSRWRP